MTKINELAKQHAQKILGAQYEQNPDAAKSIEADFKKGFKAAEKIFKPKHDKWNKLGAVMDRMYAIPEDDENVPDLVDIGEVAASHFGYL